MYKSRSIERFLMQIEYKTEISGKKFDIWRDKNIAIAYIWCQVARFVNKEKSLLKLLKKT